MGWISRRNILKTTLAAGALSSGHVIRLRAQQPPIRIGLLLPLSGSLGQNAHDVLLGAQIATKQVNAAGGIHGRNLELVVRDDKTNPNEAAGAVREFLSDNIKLIMGGLFTAEVAAISPIVKSGNGLLIANGAIGMDISHDNFDRHIFHSRPNDYMETRAFVRLALEKYPHVTSWSGCYTDLEAPRSSWALFKHLMAAEFEKAGKKFVVEKELLAKPGATEFRTILSELAASPTQGLYNIIFGQDGVTFMQQARGFNLGKNIKVTFDRPNDFGLIKALGKNPPSDYWCIADGYRGLYKNLPQAKSVYDDYVAMTGDKNPGGWLSYGLIPVNTYAQTAIAAGGSGDPDPDALIRVLESGLKIQTAKGMITYRKEDHQALSDIDLVRFDPSSDAQGFKVSEAAKYDGAALVEPAAPGVPFRI